MSYIRAQFVERDETGRIIKGSAAICEAVDRTMENVNRGNSIKRGKGRGLS